MFYKGGAKAGFTPKQVDEMTLWEFSCCMAGLNEFHGVKQAPPEMSDEMLAELGIEGFD